MTILIVIPVLTLLMFELGLTLQPADFKRALQSPRAIVAGLTGQLIALPLLALLLDWLFALPAVMFMGLMLIACSPGGSSSNVFSLLAKGDVALSVSLTACSSILTLFTIPVVMYGSMPLAGGDAGTTISLPVGKLIVQNLVLALLPILVGMFIRSRWERVALRVSRVLEKIALPLLILLVAVFYAQNSAQLTEAIPTVGPVVGALILLAMAVGWGLSRLAKLGFREEKTLVIEVGMQNAAQAIAMASSPFVFNDEVMGIPAIVYSLLMNLFLIPYVMWAKRRTS